MIPITKVSNIVITLSCITSNYQTWRKAIRVKEVLQKTIMIMKQPDYGGEVFSV